MPSSPDSPRSPAVLMLLSSEVVASRHRALRETAPDLEVVTSLDACDPERIDALFALGCRVTGWSGSGRGVEGMHAMYAGEAQLPEFLAQTDTLVCLLPFTAATRGVLDGALLRKLKPGAFVINAARGGILDEAAL